MRNSTSAESNAVLFEVRGASKSDRLRFSNSTSRSAMGSSPRSPSVTCASPYPWMLRMSLPSPERSIAAESTPRNDCRPRNGPRIGVKLCPGEPQRGAVLGCGVQADRAAAHQLAPQQVARQVFQPGLPVLDVERRLQVGDLLTHQADAHELDDAVNLERPAVGPAAHVLELALDVLQRDARLEAVVVEHDQRPVPAAPRRLTDHALPANLQVAPRREGPAVVQAERRTGPSGGA